MNMGLDLPEEMQFSLISTMHTQMGKMKELYARMKRQEDQQHLQAVPLNQVHLLLLKKTQIQAFSGQWD
jgi:hypothetical protein